jgi:hypothetical protein
MQGTNLHRFLCVHLCFMPPSNYFNVISEQLWSTSFLHTEINIYIHENQITSEYISDDKYHMHIVMSLSNIKNVFYYQLIGGLKYLFHLSLGTLHNTVIFLLKIHKKKFE